MSNKIEKLWWKDKVVYQIYPRSFMDSNGDGIGDLKGVIQKLDYLKELGIGAIWLSPVCKSPQEDYGYDISDYKDIDPMFGSLSDMDELINEANQRGIKIILDLVLNHSSNQHPWFKEALKSKDNPYHDYYVWRDGKEGELPNDLKACFGGSAWEWVPSLGQYYFHQFAIGQPDLNWENPKLRRELYDMILWWMDRGIGGFRMDVIDQIAKEPDLKITGNGPKLHDFLQEMSRETFQKGDLITVGEAWGADTNRAKLYSNPDGSEFSMVFQFEHIGLDQQKGKEKWDLAPLPFLKLKKIFEHWQNELQGCGWNSLFWNNHDLPRIVSRWGNDKVYWLESAKMLATLLHGMQGTPYVFQGEEIGMTNIKLPIERYKDIEIVNMYKERIAKGYAHEDIMNSIYVKGRDNARTPMQWTDESNAGFTSGTPWIDVNENYKKINVQSQINDPNSIFNYYKELIALRKSMPIFVEGTFKMRLKNHKQIMAYERSYKNQKMLVICNFFEQEILCPLQREWRKMDLLLSNYSCKDESENTILKPYEARIYISNLDM